MHVRVKQGRKGHFVRGRRYEHADGAFEIRGDEVPGALADKLEPASAPGPSRTAKAPQQPAGGQQGTKPVGGDEQGWYDQLGADLGKEPTKEDLREYAQQEHDLELDPDVMRKDEMIAQIDEAERGSSQE